MNKVTKKRLLIVVGIIFLWWFFFFDLRVYQLNNVLADNSEIDNYPYPFSVVSFDAGVATISSPRSGKVSAVTVLKQLFPELRNESESSLKMVEAQQILAATQSKVAELIKQQEDVKRVTWELDEYWLSSHGIEVF
ncbi:MULTISPECIES: hypothetical protein [Aliiglaciecola]|uniref:hypothetical protein n=1 Tax=Aliiglaciecola TaxID=1406885 RepID=UPI001C096860|nr:MULTISPECIES: hypothetical protein [Aliiglaciecola]MBU2877391.1 hypothetical protein [Aliiglaciecola lipolytica]MDO6712813.1 hypothetical protein [Aliiglaciecola sp. 2_MG-2023]MDO6753908.1 hypothetical protein [Aliiglaciecola sp. 1_MG-2023]